MHVSGETLQLGVQLVERHLQLVDVAFDLTKIEIHLLQAVQQSQVHRVEPLLDPVEADPHLVAEIGQLLADLLELLEDHQWSVAWTCRTGRRRR
jgi:NAD(P)H-dependent FMN reductase